MKTVLTEEIKKAKKLMGILNEAAPGGGILKALFRNLVADQIDNAFSKIEAKIGSSLSGSNSITSLERAITNKQITKKEALTILLDTLGMSDDSVAELIEKEVNASFVALQTAAKNKQTRGEIIAAVPELADLPDGVINSLLKKAGVKIGDEITVRELIGTLSGSYPELFAETWFKSYKNEKVLAGVISEANQAFSGKNLVAIVDELKVMLSKANTMADDLMKKKKMTSQQGSTFKKSAAKFFEALNPITKQMTNPSKVDWVRSGKQFTVMAVSTYLMYKLGKNWYETGSPIGGAVKTGSDEYELAKKYVTPATGSKYDLKNYFMKKFGYTQAEVDALKIEYIGASRYTVAAGGGTTTWEYDGKAEYINKK